MWPLTGSRTDVGAGGDSAGLYMMDLLKLKPGVDPQQAEVYFSKIGPVIAKHGLENVYRFQVETKMAGAVEPQIVNLWSVRGPDTMPGIMNDPAYQANMALRDSTFEMPEIEMFMLQATGPFDQTEAPLLFVDLLDLQPRADTDRAAEYFSRIEPIVEGHGLVPVARFEVTKKMAGSMEPKLVNLWTMRGPDTFPGIMQDPRYQDNVAFRNATFDMKSAAMYTLKPVAK